MRKLSRDTTPGTRVFSYPTSSTVYTGTLLCIWNGWAWVKWDDESMAPASVPCSEVQVEGY